MSAHQGLHTRIEIVSSEMHTQGNNSLHCL